MIQTILVALVIEGDTEEDAANYIKYNILPDIPTGRFDSWWVASDDTGMGEAATFIPDGLSRAEARDLLEDAAAELEEYWL
jgi:hypothetical protein